TSAHGASTRRTARRRSSSRTAPATTSGRRTSGTSGGLVHAENLARDDDPLDLARPFVNLRDLRVTVVALDRELSRVAVAAEDLDRLAGLAARYLRGQELRLRARLRHTHALVLQRSGAVDEQPGGVDLGRHVRELELDRLVLGDALAEGLTLPRVLARDVVRRLRDADRLRRDADAAAVERLHRYPEALVLFVEQTVAPDV